MFQKCLPYGCYFRTADTSVCGLFYAYLVISGYMVCFHDPDDIVTCGYVGEGVGEFGFGAGAGSEARIIAVFIQQFHSGGAGAEACYLTADGYSIAFRCREGVGVHQHTVVVFLFHFNEFAVYHCREIGDILLSKLKGRSIGDVNTTLMKEISGELQAELDIVDSIFEMMSDAMKSSGEEKVFLEGTLNILNQPEFNDVARVKEVLSFLQEEEILKELLHGKNGIGMNFTIGDELSSDKINRCSMVTCTYSINGNTMGNIGILGPTRMEYAKSASLIREVAKQLSSVLENKPK